MIFLGIDPGISGALAFYNTLSNDLEVFDMPTISVQRGGKNKTEVSPQLVSNIIAAHRPNCAFLERVGAMPGQGVTSVFSFGRSAGILEGVLAAYDIRTTIVPPPTWMKALNIRAGKDGSRQRAMELFPQRADLFARKKDDGRSDAALIAYYGATR